LPETPEQQQRLEDLMSKELIVGPDATNATSQLDDLVGDDILFDHLSDLASRDASANIWDDSDVQARLAELGIQTPAAGGTIEPPLDQAADDVDTDLETELEPEIKEGSMNQLSLDLKDTSMTEPEFFRKYGKSREQMRLSLLPVGEAHDDPMNYNAAITGAYYESKSGDALLARIKSLALLK